MYTHKQTTHNTLNLLIISHFILWSSVIINVKLHMEPNSTEQNQTAALENIQITLVLVHEYIQVHELYVWIEICVSVSWEGL